MARFLLCAMPMSGHVDPTLAIAAALAARGHEVMLYTGRAFQARAHQVGAAFTPMPAAYDMDIKAFYTTQPNRPTNYLAGVLYDMKHYVFDGIGAHMEALRPVIAAFQPDVLLGDSLTLFPSILHERGEGPPWAHLEISISIIPDWFMPPTGPGLVYRHTPWHRALYYGLNAVLTVAVFRDMQQHLRRVRASLGVDPSKYLFGQHVVSPYLYLQGTPPGFDYPRNFPPQAHRVGTLLPPAPADVPLPDWWGDVTSGERAVVVLTQGTQATDPANLLTPALAGLADLDAWLVVTGANVPAHLPPNARHAPFVPYATLMPHADAYVTNGGFGGVMFALAHGVPMVAHGTTEDKPDVCARVAYSGTGIWHKAKPTPTSLRRAVDEVLYGAQYRARAQELQAHNDQLGGPRRAADLLEHVARTGQPATAVATLSDAPVAAPGASP